MEHVLKEQPSVSDSTIRRIVLKMVEESRAHPVVSKAGTAGPAVVAFTKR
jgi:nicotinamide mononucleotide (NMN) deamidase PncC